MKDPKINTRSPHFNEERLQWLKERYGVSSQPDFEKAAAKEANTQIAESDQGRGSGMVERDKPEPHLKPSFNLRAAVEQIGFNKEWTNEQIEAVADRFRDALVHEMKQMREQQYGRILFTSSASGIIATVTVDV